MSLCISHLPHRSRAHGLAHIDQDWELLGREKGLMCDANQLLN